MTSATTFKELMRKAATRDGAAMLGNYVYSGQSDRRR